MLRETLTNRVFDSAALGYLLIEYDEYQYRRGEAHTLDELRTLVRKKITREHVLPSDPGLIDVTSYGFADIHEYREHVDRLGNVVPLTSRENARCGNRSPFEKMTTPGLYKQSCYASTRMFAAEYKGKFHKDDLIERTQRLASWVMNRWSWAPPKEKN